MEQPPNTFGADVLREIEALVDHPAKYLPGWNVHPHSTSTILQASTEPKEVDGLRQCITADRNEKHVLFQSVSQDREQLGLVPSCLTLKVLPESTENPVEIKVEFLRGIHARMVYAVYSKSGTLNRVNVGIAGGAYGMSGPRHPSHRVPHGTLRGPVPAGQRDVRPADLFTIKCLLDRDDIEKKRCDSRIDILHRLGFDQYVDCIFVSRTKDDNNIEIRTMPPTSQARSGRPSDDDIVLLDELPLSLTGPGAIQWLVRTEADNIMRRIPSKVS